MRGTQFGTLRSMLRNEISRSNEAGGSGLADFNQLAQVLNRHYETLYYDYDWPHRRVWFDQITLSAGERYYDLPSTCDYERIESIVVWFSGQPVPLTRGIDFTDFAAFSSPDDIRSGPVLKWDIRFTGTKEQIEVWPIPDDNAQKIQILGIRKFARLVNDSDTCNLDDNLVVLFAAAELAAEAGMESAPLKLKAAQTLYGRLKGRTKGASKTYTFNTLQDTASKWPPKNVDVIVAGG